MELIIIFASISAAVIAGLLVRRRGVIEFVSVASSLTVFTESIIIAMKVAVAGAYAPYPFFSVDALGAIVMLIVSIVGLSAIIYSVVYLREETAKQIIGFTRVWQYFILLNLFIAAMFAAVAASNPIIAWISIEATTLSTAFLISFYNKPSAMEAAWKYLIINAVGLLLGFFGTLLYFTAASGGEAGFATWNDLLANASLLDPMIAKIAFIFILIGYGTKVGFAPMHTWKPDAYSKSPAPIGAVFSGALLPVTFMIIMKFRVITDSIVGPLFSSNLLILFGMLSIAVASFILFSSRNYKRLLAYSSIENAGIMALGFGFGGPGVFAAILHLIYNSFLKAALFLLAGNILLKYYSAKIANVRGMIEAIPVTSALFLASFLFITGMPPSGVFLTKMSILSVGIQTHPVVSVAAIFLMSFVFIGFLRHAMAMVFGVKPAEVESGEGSVWLLIPPFALIVAAVYLSFYIPPFLNTLLTAAAAYY